MSIVLTNWNAAFQKERGTWSLTACAVFAFVFGSIAWVRGSSAASIIDHSLGILLLAGPGWAILRLQRATVAKPLLFGLPGYRESLAP